MAPTPVKKTKAYREVQRYRAVQLGWY